MGNFCLVECKKMEQNFFVKKTSKGSKLNAYQLLFKRDHTQGLRIVKGGGSTNHETPLGDDGGGMVPIQGLENGRLN